MNARAFNIFPAYSSLSQRDDETDNDLCDYRFDTEIDEKCKQKVMHVYTGAVDFFS